jgi:hypothetical protein
VDINIALGCAYANLVNLNLTSLFLPKNPFLRSKTTFSPKSFLIKNYFFTKILAVFMLFERKPLSLVRFLYFQLLDGQSDGLLYFSQVTAII